MATQQYSDELKGVLFPEKEKKNEKGPDVTGNATVNGTKYRVAGWKRSSTSSGLSFYSLTFQDGDKKATKDSKELTGVLFPVKEKKNEKGPDVTGNAIIEGVEYRVAGWKKTGKNGPFYSLTLELPRAKGENAKATPAAATPPVDDDDPF